MIWDNTSPRLHSIARQIAVQRPMNMYYGSETTINNYGRDYATLLYISK
jgi:hypothetical protein